MGKHATNGRYCPALTEEEKALIRQCWAEKQRIDKAFSVTSLAEKFGVSPPTISRAIRGR